MNNKKKQQSSAPAIAIAVFIALMGIAADLAEDGVLPQDKIGIVLVVIVLLVAGVAFGVKAAKGTAKKTDADRPVRASSVRTTATRPTASARPTVRAAGQKTPQRTYASASGDHRREQLDSFLKNGIIDRSEYNALLRRWDVR